MAWRLVFPLALVAGACSIQVDDEPREIPEQDRRELETDEQQAGSAQGATHVFLVAPSEPNERRELRAVLRDNPNDPTSVMQALLRGPNDAEVGNDLTTALPSGLELLSATRLGGTVTVDVSDELLNVSGEGSILAVGQIVATASELDGVSSVRLTVEGDSPTWIGSNGEPIDNPLTVYDFPLLIESSQPPYPGLPSQ